VDVHLRPTTAADLDFVVAAERDADTAPYIVGWPRERHAAALTDPDLCHRIVVRPDGVVGFILLAGLTGPNRAIEFRRLVVAEKGRGYGRASIRAVLRLAFDELKAHRLWLDVKTHNARARRLYVSEGFVLEGVLRDCLARPDGDYDSLAVMSMLATEYREAESGAGLDHGA